MISIRVYKELLFLIIFTSFAFSTNKVTIRGTVKGSNGKLIKKAKIELLNAKKEKVKDLESDKKGKFVLEDLDAKNYHLNITKKKESGKVIIRAWPSGNLDIDDLEIELSEKGTKVKTSFGPEPTINEEAAALIKYDTEQKTKQKAKKRKKMPKKAEKVFVSGKVLNKKGKPVKKAVIILIDENYNAVSEIETNKEGLFKIENLKPANYTLTISKKKMLVKFKLKLLIFFSNSFLTL